MLKFYYESGNDNVAFSRKNICLKAKEFIDLYKNDKKLNNKFIISQVDMINAIGSLIYEEHILYNEVVIIVEDLEKEFYFDKEGVLTESWYGIVSTFDY